MSLSGLPWYAHDIEAYTRKTRGLTMEQDGAYRRLMDHYYDSEAPLPAPLPEVFRIARCSSKSEQKSVTHVLNAYFTLENDGWHNRRSDEELAKRQGISERRSKAGANGVAKRKQKREQTDSKPSANADTLNTRQSLEPNGSKQKGADALFVLPEWVPQPAWDEFIKSRKRLKANPTEHAKTLLVRDLETLQTQGFAPQDILEAATKNSWKGLYPPPSQRQTNGSGHSEKRSTTDQHLAGIASLIADERAKRARG